MVASETWSRSLSLGNLEQVAQLGDAGDAPPFEHGLDAIMPLGRDQALDHRAPEQSSRQG